MKLNIKDETGRLRVVILGTGRSMGPSPTLEEAFNPNLLKLVLDHTYPSENAITDEMDAVAKVLEKHKIAVIRPTNLTDVRQIFARDIGFVIDDTFIFANTIDARAHEIEGIQVVVDRIAAEKRLRPPRDVRIEGGDVIVHHGKIFVGYSEDADFKRFKSARTNAKGVAFLKQAFPHYKIYPLQLIKSDEDPSANIMHLDCCFQPIGRKMALIAKEGFKSHYDYEFIVDYIGCNKIIDITAEEMVNLHTNILSLSDNVLLSSSRFVRLNTVLRDKGFTVEEINYSQTAKLAGLFRCSTLPLVRE